MFILCWKFVIVYFLFCFCACVRACVCACVRVCVRARARTPQNPTSTPRPPADDVTNIRLERRLALKQARCNLEIYPVITVNWLLISETKAVQFERRLGTQLH